MKSSERQKTEAGVSLTPAHRRTKGRNSIALELRILDVVRGFRRLTVRQIYYILISTFGYPSSRAFYRLLDYHLVKMRRRNTALHAKFVDPTRQFAAVPCRVKCVELWVEKDTIRSLLQDVAARYGVGIQVLRGFASLTMFRKALLRAAEREVKTILYVGDLDPSGVLIDKVAAKEMRLKIRRVALTHSQVHHFKLRSHPVNRRDSRAEAYMKRYGDRAWEIEAMRPRTLFTIVESQLKRSFPREVAADVSVWSRASKVAKPIAENIKAAIEEEVFRLLKQGQTPKQASSQISSKFAALMHSNVHQEGENTNEKIIK